MSFNQEYARGLLAGNMILAVIILIMNATGILNGKYFSTFMPISIGVSLFMLLVIISERIPGLRTVFYTNSPDSPIRSIPLKIGIAMILGFLSIIWVTSLKSAVIDIPQPFTEQSYAIAGTADKYIFQSIVPGLMEEALIFAEVLGITYILKLMFKPKTYMAMLIIFMIASAAGAGTLTLGHRAVYGTNQDAYIGVFTFEFAVQFFNLFTGMFISFIPHITHNMAVVALSYSIFSIVSYSILIPTLIKNQRLEE